MGVVVVVVCFGKRVFPDLFTVLLIDSVDFILASVYGAAFAYAESSSGARSVYDPVWIFTAKCGHRCLGCQ